MAMSWRWICRDLRKKRFRVSLEDGNLTIQAAKGLDEDEKEKKTGRYIRRERYAGSCAEKLLCR